MGQVVIGKLNCIVPVTYHEILDLLSNVEFYNYKLVRVGSEPLLLKWRREKELGYCESEIPAPTLMIPTTRFPVVSGLLGMQIS